MSTVAIVGLGVIGGSLALALKGTHAVRGVDKDAKSRDLAQAAGIAIFDALDELVSGADLVVIAIPMGKLAAMVEAAGRVLPAGAVLTDVGGVKAAIVAAGRSSVREGGFVGGHPIAGNTSQGFTSADAGLFREAFWALTPETEAEMKSAARIKEILAPTGAKFVEMSPEAHDLSIAYTSHMPYLMALALTRAAQSATREGLPAIEQLIGPGFKDTTRLAMTPPELGKDMAVQNLDAIMKSLGAIRYQLAQIEIILQGDLGHHIEGIAQGASEWRKSLS